MWPRFCDRFSCIRNYRFYCYIYCVGEAEIVEIIVHIYNISLIGLPQYLCSWYLSTVIVAYYYGVGSGLFCHVTIISIGEWCAGVYPHNVISMCTAISYWIQLLFILISCSFLSSLLLLMFTIFYQSHICYRRGLDFIR